LRFGQALRCSDVRRIAAVHDDDRGGDDAYRGQAKRCRSKHRPLPRTFFSLRLCDTSGVLKPAPTKLFWHRRPLRPWVWCSTDHWFPSVRLAGNRSAYVAAALQEKIKRDDLEKMLDEMLAVSGGPLTSGEIIAADAALGSQAASADSE